MSEVALPMENNPETMSKYLHKLGVPEEFKLVDVMDLDKDALSSIPRPVLAVILLFPVSDLYEIHRVEEERRLTDQGVVPNTDVFHMKQVLSNVYGTIALVHSVANNIQSIEMKDGLLKKYLEEAKNLDAPAKGVLLENSKGFLNAYKELIGTGEAQAGTEEELPNHHFVTFVHKNGTLFELDGRKSYPVEHGTTTPETLLEDASKVCREFIAREPNNIGFSIVALVRSQDK